MAAIAGATLGAIMLIVMGGFCCAVANTRKLKRQEFEAAQLRKEEHERKKIEKQKLAELQKRLAL